MQRLPNSGDSTFLSVPMLLQGSSLLSQQEWWLRGLPWNLFRGKATLIYYGQSEMRERLFAGEVILGIKWTCGANKRGL